MPASELEDTALSDDIIVPISLQVSDALPLQRKLWAVQAAGKGKGESVDVTKHEAKEVQQLCRQLGVAGRSE